MGKPDIRILVGVEGGASISGESGKLILSELQEIARQISGNHMPRVKIAVNMNETRRVFQQQLQSIANGLDITANVKTKFSDIVGPNKVFDTAALEVEGRRYYQATNDIIQRVKQDFASVGKVDTSIFKNAKGEIQSFTVSVKDADTVLEQLHFRLAQLKDSDGTVANGFVQMNSVLSDKTAGSGLENTLNYLTRIETKLAGLSSQTLVTGSRPLLPEMEQYGQYNTRLQEVKTRIEEIRTSTAALSDTHKREIDTMVADLQRYAKELQTSAYAGGELKAQPFATKKAQYQAELENSIKQWRMGGVFDGAFEQEVNKAKTLLDSATDSTGLDNYTRKLRLLKAEFQGFKLDNSAWDKLTNMDTLATRISTAQQRVQNLKTTYSAFVSDPALMKEWNSLFDQSKIVSSEKELTNLNAKISDFEQRLISAGKHGTSIFAQFAQNFQKMATWTLISMAVSSITQGVRGVYDAVVEVDTAMVELKKVTSATKTEYAEFLNIAAKRSVELGSGLQDLIQATANFARLGEYTLKTAERLGEVATVYYNVGDEVDSIDSATSSIVSTMKAFRIAENDAMSIADKFNEVGNNFAISSGGIGEALQRSASSLALANNTLDESIGLIVAANDVTQNPEAIGTMWKTVSMRIRGAKAELEAAGLETEGMAESVSKLRELVAGLTNVNGRGGFDIMADENTFKSTYQIIEGISKVWDKMKDVDQAALLELLAGKRQGNALASAVTNFTDAEKAMQTAMTSSGSAMAEHSKWLDSVEAKQQRFSAQYQAFANSVLDSGLIKGTFDAGTGILGWLTSLVDTLGAVPPLVAALYGIQTVAKGNGVFQVDSSGKGITTLFSAGKQAATEMAAQLDADYQSLLKWENSVQQGKRSIKDFELAMSGASKKARTYALDTKGAAGSATAFKVSQDAAALSTQKMGIASTIASVGVKALSLAMNMALAFGISFAVQAAVTWIMSLGKEAEKSAESMRTFSDSCKQIQSEISSLESELKSVRSRLEELDELARTGRIMPDQERELKDLQATREELERQLDVQRELAQLNKTNAENAAVDTYNATKYTSVTGATQQVVSYEGVILTEDAQFSGVDQLNNLVAAMQRIKSQQEELKKTRDDDEISAADYTAQMEALQAEYDKYNGEAATVADNQMEIADAIYSTSGANYELKQSILSAIDAWRALSDDSVAAIHDVSEAAEDAADKVTDYATLLKGFQDASKSIEDYYSALKELENLDGAEVPIDLMAEIMELCPEAAGMIQNVADAQQVLTDKIEEQKSIAETTYSKMILSNQDWLQNTINASATLQNSLAKYYGTDLDNFRKLAGTKWEIEKALVSDLASLWSKYENRTLDSLEKQLYYLNYQSPEPNLEQIRELQAVIDMRKALTGQLGDLITYKPSSVTSSKSGSSSSTNKETDKVKNAFQEVYNEKKHLVDMDKMTLEDFYAWLNGENGYKKYFSDLTKYADEYRKYEKEVFDGLRQIHEGYIEDLGFEIDMLERQDGAETQVIAKLREKQAAYRQLLLDTEAYLRAAGMSEDQISRNDLVQEYTKAMYSVEDSIREVEERLYEDSRDKINDLIDLTEDMVKQEKEDMIDALEAQKDAYSNLISQRKELLQLAQREKSYNDEVADKNKEIQKLQSRIADLGRDDSRAAAYREGETAGRAGNAPEGTGRQAVRPLCGHV